MGDAPRSRSTWWVAFTALFFALFYLYIWLVIDPRLLYENHPDFPVFLAGATFFKATMAQYGGPADYVGGLLAQAYYVSWLGAIVITVLTGLICLMLDVLARAMGGLRARIIALVPAVIVLVAHNHHLNQVTLLVGLLAALACAALYARAPLERDGWRVGLFLLLSLALYFAAGGSYLLFAVLAGIYELLGKRRRLPALVAFLSIEAVPYFLGTYLFELDLATTYAYLLPYHVDTTEQGREIIWAYVLPPVALVAIGLWQLVAARRKERTADPASGRGEAAEQAERSSLVEHSRSWRRRAAIGWLAFLGIAAVSTLLSYNASEMTALRIVFYAKQDNWQKVLEAADDLPVHEVNLLTSQHVNEALFHTGRLPYEMFRYPQCTDGLLFDMDLSQDVDQKNQRIRATKELFHQLGDLDLQLGLVNEAEHEGHEALAIHGAHGAILYRLALINLVKRQPAAARVFLRALSRHLVYGEQAADLLGRLSTDSSLSSDLEVKRIRSVMLREDEAIMDLSGEREYVALLEANRHNRMAFEYLMAFYLLARSPEALEKLATNLPRLRDFEYPDIPRHYQEAILLYERDTTKRVDRCGHEISDDVLQEFADFSRDLGIAGGQEAAAQMLMGRYGNTYLYYYLTGMSGLGDQ